MPTIQAGTRMHSLPRTEDRWGDDDDDDEDEADNAALPKVVVAVVLTALAVDAGVGKATPLLSAPTDSVLLVWVA